MTKNKDIFREAIAEANDIKKVAIEYATESLKEQFNPRLQQIVSKRLQEEEDELDDEEILDDEEMIEEEDEMDLDIEDDEEIEEEMYSEDYEEELEEGEEDIEIEDDEDSDIDSELEEILRELEDDETDEDMVEEEEESDEDEDFDLDIEDDELEEGEDFDMEDEDDEEIDLDEILRELDDEYDFEEEDEDEASEELEEELREVKSQLRQAMSTINKLRESNKEVGILNTKLLFANKIFSRFSLNESQKRKVIEILDKVTNLREAKIAYASMIEAYSNNSSGRKITEAFASKKTTRKPTGGNIIDDDPSERVKKLAGIRK